MSRATVCWVIAQVNATGSVTPKEKENVTEKGFSFLGFRKRFPFLGKTFFAFSQNSKLIPREGKPFSFKKFSKNCKLSKVCGVIYKLRHYVPFSTLKLVYYAMFHSHLQNSLVNWGRANKIHYHNLVILQNKILRASLFLPMHHPTNLLYTKFGVLKLDDMIKMELAKFMFKFNNKMFPNSFNNYFLRLDKLHKYNTRQTKRNEYFQSFISSEAGRRVLCHRYSTGSQALFFL